ncbi:MAG: lytic transglycosylase domain-containing protein [Alphaproteobacteria bacterium]
MIRRVLDLRRTAPMKAVAAVLCFAAFAAAPVPAAAGDDRLYLAPNGITAAGSALPRPLDSGDVERYRRIFALQKDGNWRRADREIKQLGDRLLMGHVMAQRYLHPRKYRSRYRELSAWLKLYNDHPDARRIYKLALKRRGSKNYWPRPPVRNQGPLYSSAGANSVSGYVSPRRRGVQTRRKARSMKYRIRRLVRANRLSVAERTLKRRDYGQTLDRVERDMLAGRIAAGWFYYGNDGRALALARPAARRSGRHAPSINWFAGLAAYRLGKHAEAAGYFESMAGSNRLDNWTIASAAFWAARSNMVARHPDRVAHWLNVAAERSRTFYGILARRILGLPSPFNWDRSKLEPQHIEAMTRDRRALRALALLQVGRENRAERELRAMSRSVEPDMAVALLAIADRAGMPSVAMRTAGTLAAAGNHDHSYGFYPVPRWKPSGGFRVDRAVIYAFMRQESAFKVRAKSHAGARGLMQLMPATASYIAQRRFRGRARNKLFEPGLNIALGQKYLNYLIKHNNVGGDMFLLAAAYNGGPGNLGKWQRRVSKVSTDPLMFIESIPARETREFIERVLSNLWIYRERLGQAAPSLDAIAAGRRPLYKALDNTSVATAQNVSN